MSRVSHANRTSCDRQGTSRHRCNSQPTVDLRLYNKHSWMYPFLKRYLTHTATLSQPSANLCACCTCCISSSLQFEPVNTRALRNVVIILGAEMAPPPSSRIARRDRHVRFEKGRVPLRMFSAASQAVAERPRCQNEAGNPGLSCRSASNFHLTAW